MKWGVHRSRHGWPLKVATLVVMAVGMGLGGCSHGVGGGSPFLADSPSPATSGDATGVGGTTSPSGGPSVAETTPPVAMTTSEPAVGSDTPLPEVAATPTPEPVVGAGTLTVGGSERFDVVGDCVVAGMPDDATAMVPAAQLSVAVTSRPGDEDTGPRALVVGDGSDADMVRLEGESQDGQRAWEGAIDQVRVARADAGQLPRLVLNATVSPVPGAPSLPVATVAPGDPGAPAPTGSVTPTPNPRPVPTPAPAPSDAVPIRVSAVLTCEVTSEVAE